MGNLERNCFYRIMFLFIDLFAFKLGKLCPGVGIFVSFFRPGGRSFALKSCPREGGGDGNRSNWYLHKLAVRTQLSSYVSTPCWMCKKRKARIFSSASKTFEDGNWPIPNSIWLTLTVTCSPDSKEKKAITFWIDVYTIRACVALGIQYLRE